MSKELTREKVNSARGGIVVLRFRKKLLHAPPAETSWLRVLHQIFILARAFDTRPAITEGTDLEIVALSQNKRFWELYNAAIKKGGGKRLAASG